MITRITVRVETRERGQTYSAEVDLEDVGDWRFSRRDALELAVKQCERLIEARKKEAWATPRKLP